MKRIFTIIAAVLTAVVLLTVVWCFAYPRLFPQRMLAQQTEMHMIFLAAAASEGCRFQGAWPASIQQLVARPDPSGNMAVFLKSGTNDAWGRPIVFEPFSSPRGYGRIISYGADGQPGGEGSARDIILHYGENQKMSFAKRESDEKRANE